MTVRLIVVLLNAGVVHPSATEIVSVCTPDNVLLNVAVTTGAARLDSVMPAGAAQV